MKSCSRIHSPAFAVICGLAIASGFAVPRAQADEWNKKTILTVNEPIQVTNKLLDPGRYVFMLLNSSSNRHIVEIFDADQTHLIDTVMAVPNYRIQPTGNSRFLFWETPPGTAKALRAWFYPGDNFGQEFRYPEHPAVLEARATMPAVINTAAAPPTEEATPAEPQAQAETAAPAAVQTAPEQQQPEVAQNNPPPAPPSAEPAPQPSQEQPNQLPQTASEYPLVGFAGLILLAAAGGLRLRRLGART